jgi:DNA-binding MarR family transcriptional regulator
MVKSLAKKAMTTKGQKACYVIDHLVEALGNEPSSSLRRAIILADIDQHPGTTQTGILERLQVHKSALNREIEWLFNYGCIMRQSSNVDGREVPLMTCGYSRKSLESALDYFGGSHQNLKKFLEGFTRYLKQERPSLRDAKIVSTVYSRKRASKQDIMNSLYQGGSSTDHRAINDLVSEGVIGDVRTA